MEPAATIIAKFAVDYPDRRKSGEQVVSEITGTAYTAPYRWQYPKAKGGTDGAIPARHIPALLSYAKANGIAITAADFFLEVAA